jgi:hypothetical protein
MRACAPAALFALVASMLPAATPVLAAPLPTRVGQCSETAITVLASRLEKTPESGSAVEFENGGYQVSYEIVPQLQRSRVGDKVRMCLTTVPRDCPKGDDRGRIYRTTNLRTGEGWTLPDSQHSCGGA